MWRNSTKFLSTSLTMIIPRELGPKASSKVENGTLPVNVSMNCCHTPRLIFQLTTLEIFKADGNSCRGHSGELSVELLDKT